MKLLAIEAVEPQRILGFLELDDNYVQFDISREDEVKITHSQAKSEFEDYDTYCGVYGKFNPETMFLKDPIELKELTYNGLLKLWNRKDFPKGWL